MSEQAVKFAVDYKNAYGAVAEHFPNAQRNQDVFDAVIKNLQLPAEGSTPSNTLYAQSVCSDEINHECGDITSLFINHFEEVFHLGGLAGIPFTGKGGFQAYVHHAPEGDGKLFVLLAPHIGVTTKGELGLYERIGQKCHAGPACGAAVGALVHWRKSGNKAETGTRALATPAGQTAQEPEPKVEDYQMEFLKKKIKAFYDSLPADQKAERASGEGSTAKENETLAAMIKEFFAIALDTLHAIIQDVMPAEWDSHENLVVYVLGGIQINMPTGVPDLFEPLVFRKYTDSDRDGKPVEVSLLYGTYPTESLARKKKSLNEEQRPGENVKEGATRV